MSEPLPTAGLVCREAVTADLTAVLAIYAQPALDDGNTMSLAQAEQHFAKLRQYPDYHLYVALLDDRIVGTFSILIMDNMAHCGAPSAIVEDVTVDPLHQGAGIGRAMMRYAMQLAARRGCYKLMLSSALSRDKAHRFYDSLGFERHGYSFLIDPVFDTEE